LNKAVDFVKKQIDEFEKRIFGRGKKKAIAEKSGKKGNWNTKLNKKKKNLFTPAKRPGLASSHFTIT